MKFSDVQKYANDNHDSIASKARTLRLAPDDVQTAIRIALDRVEDHLDRSTPSDSDTPKVLFLRTFTRVAYELQQKQCDPTPFVRLISVEPTIRVLKVLQTAIFRLDNSSRQELMDHIEDARNEYEVGTKPHLRTA